jgi:hypothetical protein
MRHSVQQLTLLPVFMSHSSAQYSIDGFPSPRPT